MPSTPWTDARKRAKLLRDRHQFVGQVLCLYHALCDVWEEAWLAARDEQPTELAKWAAERVLPKVVAITHESGPQPLAECLEPVFDQNAAVKLLEAWLAGDELVPVERYLARTSLRAPLAAVGSAACGLACAADPSPRGDRRCPSCGGPPQFSFHTATGDRLVSGRRRLQCARCGDSWNFSSSTCAYCGETEGARRTVYSEQHGGPVVGRAEGDDGDGAGPVFPHIRVEACATCERYLIDVDLGVEPRAVPEVDELAALPLDLYAAEQGFSKITPNVMGF